MRAQIVIAVAIGVLAASFIGGAFLGGRLGAPAPCSCDSNLGLGIADREKSPAALGTEAALRSAPGAERPSEPPSARLDALEARLVALEREVGTIDRQLAPAEPPLPTTPDEIRDELSRLQSPFTKRQDPDRARRTALLEHFLTTFPQHPDASSLLATLVEDGIRVGDPTKAIADLDRFASSIGLPDWKRDRILANVHSSQSNIAPLRETYERIVASTDAPVSDRASARFFYGYTFMQEGRYADARAVFNDLIETFGNESDTRVQSTVQSARDHILKSDEWERR